MSPELILIFNRSDFGQFNPEKSDIFSLGLSFLRLVLLLSEKQIIGMNYIEEE